MIEFLRPLMIRVFTTIAPRAAVTMVATGGALGYTSHIVDLRGQLPVSQEKHYRHRPVENVKGVVWHHSATKAQTIATIAEYHIEVRKWPGIAYHYAIGWDGTIYACNDPTTISYQASGYNSRTIGVVLIGNYQEREMTDAMKASAKELNEFLYDRYHLQFAWMHGETKATICPGNYAVEYLRPLLYGPRP